MSGSQPGLGAAHASSRSAILDLIRAAGTISRVELTRATGLTGATMSTVVRGSSTRVSSSRSAVPSPPVASPARSFSWNRRRATRSARTSTSPASPT